MNKIKFEQQKKDLLDLALQIIKKTSMQKGATKQTVKNTCKKKKKIENMCIK